MICGTVPGTVPYVVRYECHSPETCSTICLSLKFSRYDALYEISTRCTISITIVQIVQCEGNLAEPGFAALVAWALGKMDPNTVLALAKAMWGYMDSQAAKHDESFAEASERGFNWSSLRCVLQLALLFRQTFFCLSRSYRMEQIKRMKAMVRDLQNNPSQKEGKKPC